MIHAQQRHERATGTPDVPEPRDQGRTALTELTEAPVVPAQQKRRPDAYDLYAEIFALRAESNPA